MNIPLDLKIKFCQALVKYEGKCSRSLAKTGITFRCSECFLADVKGFDFRNCDYPDAERAAAIFISSNCQDKDNQI